MTNPNRIDYEIQPSQTLHGQFQVPGDKSISHRAIMLGALAQGHTRVSGFLTGADCIATMNAFRALGVSIEAADSGQLLINGVGLQGLQAPDQALDLGNSGTAMRLLTGILAAQTFDSTVIGDASLNQRPMQRITQPLQRMGADITTTASGTAPLHIRGGQALRGIDYALPVASAQIKSCLLLAGMYARGQTRITEPAPTRDHTERMLVGFGYPVQHTKNAAALTGGAPLRAATIAVPGDISSAAFFMVAASIADDAELVLSRVGINPTRTGVITILQLMGADIELFNQQQIGAEPVADIRVRSAPLHGIKIPPAQVPLAIDEFPALFIAAAAARGETVLSDAAELRVKESDRIQTMANGLQTLGVAAQPTPDGLIIQGTDAWGGGNIDSHGDHRIAMAFAVAGLRAQEPIYIHDCANVDTSFPGFVELAQQAGLAIQSGPI